MVTDSSTAVHDQALTDLLPTTLTAVANAWLAGGQPAEQLVTALLEQLDAVPGHRQLLLLQSMVDALPSVRGRVALCNTSVVLGGCLHVGMSLIHALSFFSRHHSHHTGPASGADRVAPPQHHTRRDLLPPNHAPRPRSPPPGDVRRTLRHVDHRRSARRRLEHVPGLCSRRHGGAVPCNVANSVDPRGGNSMHAAAGACTAGHGRGGRARRPIWCVCAARGRGAWGWPYAAGVGGAGRACRRECAAPSLAVDCCQGMLCYSVVCAHTRVVHGFVCHAHVDQP